MSLEFTILSLIFCTISGYMLGNLHTLNTSVNDILKLQKYNELLEENEHMKETIYILEEEEEE